MADAKTAAGIVSAVIAAAVFLLGLFWRRQQRRRDREALLASLEQRYSEKVQPALAYLSALKRKYDHAELGRVLLARAPPGSQLHTYFPECPPAVAAAAGSRAEKSAAADEYQVHQLTKASLDFMVAEEEARNMIKGFWDQLLGAMERGELPPSFGVARRPPTREQRQRHADRQAAARASATDAATPAPAAAQPTANQRAWHAVAHCCIHGNPHVSQQTQPVAQREPQGAAPQNAEADTSAPSSGRRSRKFSCPRYDCCRPLAGLYRVFIRLRRCAIVQWFADLYWRLPWLQLQPGHMRFAGSDKGLWRNRAHNCLKLVEPCDIANFYRLQLDTTGKAQHYSNSRPETFWRLDEMCQHEFREKARTEKETFFSYMFTREWADHMQEGRARDELPNPWKARPVRVSMTGREWCKPIAACEVDV